MISRVSIPCAHCGTPGAFDSWRNDWIGGTAMVYDPPFGWSSVPVKTGMLTETNRGQWVCSKQCLYEWALKHKPDWAEYVRSKYDCRRVGKRKPTHRAPLAHDAEYDPLTGSTSSGPLFGKVEK